jgi:glycerol transport system permease protein
MRARALIPILWIVFQLLPMFWLVSPSFSATNEILGGFSAPPQQWTPGSHRTILTAPTRYSG